MAIIDAILDALLDDAPVEDLRIGAKASAVLSRRLGVACSLPLLRSDDRAAAPTWTQPPWPESARQLAMRIRADDLLEASIGVAAMNSLLDPPPDSFTDGNAFDLIVTHGRGKNVTVVGHFPFVERLRRAVSELWVLELNPRSEYLPASEAPRVVPRSDVVVITATTLLNHTLDALLELARDRYVILLGPSTPLCTAFFEHGVSAICGSLVVDPQAALAGVAAGFSFREMQGLRPIIMTRR
jgi:uncharacterized protein (DUF4213/DUF364 family)